MIKNRRSFVNDCSVLKNELIVIYTMQDFQGKSPSELLKFMKARDLLTVCRRFSNSFASCSALPSPLHQWRGAFPRWGELKCTKKHNEPGTANKLLSLTIEKKLLMRLKQSENFYDVILQFAKKKRRIDLMKE